MYNNVNSFIAAISEAEVWPGRVTRRRKSKGLSASARSRRPRVRSAARGDVEVWRCGRRYGSTCV